MSDPRNITLMSFDQQDVLFDILERNKIKEVRVCLIIDRWSKDSIDIDIIPKSKSAILDEPVIHEEVRFSRGVCGPFDVHYLIWSICDDNSWKQESPNGSGEAAFVFTFFTKGRKLIVDELGQ